jgi:uncharacterized protein (TIGR03066 family)
MRPLRLGAVCPLALLLAVGGSLAAPGDMLKEQIVGSWEGKEKDVTLGLDFTRDGKLKVTVDGDVRVEGTYKLLSDAVIELTGQGVGVKETTEKVTVVLKGDELTLKDEKGKEYKLKRVKGRGLLELALESSSAGHDAVAKDMIKALSELSDVLESVKDRDTARAAAPKIEAGAEKLEAVARRGEKLKEPSKEEQERLMKKYGPELEKQFPRYLAATLAAGQKSGGDPDFLKAMKKLDEAGKALQKMGGPK